MSQLIRNVIASRAPRAARRLGGARVWTVNDEDSGQPLLEFDAFIALDYVQDAKVPQQPIEQGSFAAYNKVGTPYMLKVTLARSGSAGELKTFCDALEELAAGTRLVSVVTPERVYRSANVTGLRWQRTAESGADRVIAELILDEIRQVAPVYQDMPPEQVRDPADAGTRDGGKRQAQPATEAQRKKSDSVLYSLGRRKDAADTP